MDFGSRYVYAYDLSDTEEVSDDEFEEGMTLRWTDNQINVNTGKINMLRSGYDADNINMSGL